jgi:hypothetical protein
VLPSEHGGWVFLGVPLLLGLWCGLSVAGGWLALATTALFLTRHPLRLALTDRQRGVCYRRSVLAERCALFFGSSALGALLLAVLTTHHPFWQPLLLAAPLALLQLVAERQGRSRSLAAELAGAAALSVVAAAVALAGGWALVPALALWAMVVAWAAPAILYVRVRLRRIRGEEAARWPVWGAHGIAGLLVGTLAALGLTSWLAGLACGILMLRACTGLATAHPVRAQTVGMQEAAYALLFVVLVALGYLL